MTATERIGLHRSVAIITPDRVEVRPSRARLLGPLIEGLIAVGSVLLIVRFIDSLPVVVLMLLLLATIVLGPLAVLGFIYNAVGSSFVMDRATGAASWQQGLLGLGIGTHEVAPFDRIDHIEVTGNYDEELPGGDQQDLVQWDIVIVKDNERRLEAGRVIAARPMADEALDRANAVASALAELAGVEARLETLPEEAIVATPAALDRPARAVRRIEAERKPPPPDAAGGAMASELDEAVRIMRDAKTIAVVGVSSDPSRDSNDVAGYLMRAGYTVYMVNPTEDEVLGQRCYDSVRELPEPVDIVDIFRRPQFVPEVVDDAIEAGAGTVWMQLRIVHEEAAARAREAGLEVVMDRCTKVEHRRIPAG